MENHAIRILLVSEDEVDYALTRDLLTESRHAKVALHWKKTHEGVVESYRSDPYELYLIDYRLGERSGLELLKELMAQGRGAPVILITGKADPEVDLEAMREGAADYLVKGQINSILLEHSIRYALERQRLLVELSNLSLIDELTGLHNRRGFATLGQQQLKFARRTQVEAFLIFMDLDGLKKINDVYGHLEGDHALVETAEYLRTTFRDSDILSRWGGDEFAILATDGVTGNRSSIQVRMERSLEERNAKRAEPYPLCFSVGIARFDPKNPQALEALLAEADAEMYVQKRSRHSPG